MAVSDEKGAGSSAVARESRSLSYYVHLYFDQLNLLDEEKVCARENHARTRDACRQVIEDISG